MSYKTKISKEGNSVLSENNPNNLIFSSDYNTLKYYLSGSTSISIAGDGTNKVTETSITHNLDYVPFFIVYVKDIVYDSGYYIVPSVSSLFTTIKHATAYADETKIYFRLRNQSTDTITARFYYKIFRNNLGF